MSFSDTLERHRQLFAQLESIEPDIEKLSNDITNCLNTGGKIFFIGNGGSAADCQHLAAEFVVRYKAERAPLAAIALTVDTSILTAHANDYSFDSVFSRQLLALCQPNDLVVGLSTSGNSANIINGIEVAKQIGAMTWAWTGSSGGTLKSISENCLCIPSDETARIQEAHIFVGHWLCEHLDEVTTTR